MRPSNHALLVLLALVPLACGKAPSSALSTTSALTSTPSTTHAFVLTLSGDLDKANTVMFVDESLSTYAYYTSLNGVFPVIGVGSTWTSPTQTAHTIQIQVSIVTPLANPEGVKVYLDGALVATDTLTTLHTDFTYNYP